MTNPVVSMLQEWRLRLSEVVPHTEEKVLQLLNLPRPAEINSLQAIESERCGGEERCCPRVRPSSELE